MTFETFAQTDQTWHDQERDKLLNLLHKYVAVGSESVVIGYGSVVVGQQNNRMVFSMIMMNW